MEILIIINVDKPTHIIIIVISRDPIIQSRLTYKEAASVQWYCKADSMEIRVSSYGLVKRVDKQNDKSSLAAACEKAAPPSFQVLSSI